MNLRNHSLLSYPISVSSTTFSSVSASLSSSVACSILSYLSTLLILLYLHPQRIFHECIPIMTCIDVKDKINNISACRQFSIFSNWHSNTSNYLLSSASSPRSIESPLSAPPSHLCAASKTAQFPSSYRWALIAPPRFSNIPARPPRSPPSTSPSSILSHEQLQSDHLPCPQTMPFEPVFVNLNFIYRIWSIFIPKQ